MTETRGLIVWTGNSIPKSAFMEAYERMERHCPVREIDVVVCPYNLKHIPKSARPVLTPFPGWWGKMEMFGPGLLPCRYVYCDIDSVLVGDTAGLIERCKPDRILAAHDALRWMGCPYSSAFVVLHGGEHRDVYEKFMGFRASDTYWHRRRGGDQVWTWPHIKDRVDWIEESPEQVLSWKFGIQRLGHVVTDKTVLVNFSGQPKPWNVEPKPEFLRRA